MISSDSKVNSDWSTDFEDTNNYKSCFARSVAVNSQLKPQQFRSLDHRQLQPEGNAPHQDGAKRPSAQPLPAIETNQGVKLRKNSRSTMDEMRRFSTSSSMNSSRRTSICSSRITEIPVENIVQQSKVETLQWQLRETEKSREMYKAVMKQVVIFLERAHRNLELIGTKLNTKPVPRSKSEHRIASESPNSPNTSEDFATFKDFTWRRPKRTEFSIDEIPPEKLSQEAFRLLRTAQSLLNTQEPKLAPMNDEPDDIEFLAQLAKEFPQTCDDGKPQRSPSFSLSPKLLMPDTETKISTAFNRKLSLQLNETRRNSYKDFLKFNHGRDSPRGSVADSDNGFLSSTVNDLVKNQRRMSFNCDKAKFKPDSDKSNSPPGGSISSVEDESGFSSMNSFQDVGLPLVGDEVTTKNALLRSMLHNVEQLVLPSSNGDDNEDAKLWKKPDIAVSHKRWNSSPSANADHNSNKQTMNVLWV